MNEEIQQLKNQIAEFETWKEQKEQQQIKYPLDIQSQKIARQDLMIVTGNTVAFGDLPSFDTAIEVIVNGVSLWVLATPR